MEQNHDIFISYTFEDYYRDEDSREIIPDNIVQKVESILEDSNYKFWIDRRIGHGEDWKAKIFNAIEQSKVFLLILTENTKNSSYVSEEVLRAVDLNKHIIPIITNKKEIKIPNGIDKLINGYQQAFYCDKDFKTKLTESIQTYLDRDNKIKELEESLKKKEGELNKIDEEIGKYRVFIERLQEEIKVKRAQKEQKEYEVSVREESIKLLSSKVDETELIKEDLKKKIEDLTKSLTEKLYRNQKQKTDTELTELIEENKEIPSEEMPSTSTEDIVINPDTPKSVAVYEENKVAGSEVIAQGENSVSEYSGSKVDQESEPSAMAENKVELSNLDSKEVQKLLMKFFQEKFFQEMKKQ